MLGGKAIYWLLGRKFQSEGIPMGCYFQQGGEVNITMILETAYRKSISILVDWIGHEVNMTKTHIVFRTYAPTHFR
ncbi:hypothetical protein P3S68_001822 [Capsicum galapagoense]